LIRSQQQTQYVAHKRDERNAHTHTFGWLAKICDDRVVDLFESEAAPIINTLIAELDVQGFDLTITPGYKG
jgi:hypothetical protein